MFVAPKLFATACSRLLKSMLTLTALSISFSHAVVAESVPGDQTPEKPAVIESLLDVTVDNFVDAETAFEFEHYQAAAGGANRWFHMRETASADERGTPRYNRDTLFSLILVDISEGATLLMPENNGRYMNAMVINEHMFINKVFNGGGQYPLTTKEFDSNHVMIIVRTLVDRTSSEDLRLANELQDKMVVKAKSARNYSRPHYDVDQYKAVKKAAVALARYMPDTRKAYGKKENINSLRYTLAAASGWGGLPSAEVTYQLIEPNLPAGEYQVTVKDVPVDAYWSLSVYDRDGYAIKNKYNAYSVTNVFGKPNADGSFTIHFGGCDDGRINCLPIAQDWNIAVRLALPRKEVLDGNWRFPDPQPLH